MTSEATTSEQNRYHELMQAPCKFRLELTAESATREQIVERLKTIIGRIETLHRGVVGGGVFWESWECRSKNND